MIKTNLQVEKDGNIIFSHNGKWIYPLFALEEYLNHATVDRRLLKVTDRIVGKAAALILIYLRIGQVHGCVMSILAKEVFERYEDCIFSYDRLIERIHCRTEDILLEVNDPKIGYEFCKSRATTGK